MPLTITTELNEQVQTPPFNGWHTARSFPRHVTFIYLAIR